MNKPNGMERRDTVPAFLPFIGDYKLTCSEETPQPYTAFTNGKSQLTRKLTGRDKWIKIIQEYNSQGMKVDLPLDLTSAPWCKTNGSYSPGVIGLHCEIEDFYNYMKPTEIEGQLRSLVFNRVRLAILDLWPEAVVNCFGSFRTSLYLPTSDIDVVVIGKWDVLPLRMLEQAFRNKNFVEKDTIRVLDKASVPIVKIVDRDTKIRVDVSFNVTNAVQSAVMICNFCKEFSHTLPKLAYVLKQFLLQRELNEVFTGGISSYSLVLMIISFLQQKAKLTGETRRKNQNLGVLLIEFLELYSRHFNYMNTGIRIRDGGRYMAKHDLFPNHDTDGYRPSLLSIEDPLLPSNDIGKSSYGIMKVKDAFESAFVILSKAVIKPRNLIRQVSGETLLSKIVQVSEETVFYRQWIENKFKNSELITICISPPLGFSTNGIILSPVQCRSTDLCFSDNNNISVSTFAGSTDGDVLDNAAKATNTANSSNGFFAVDEN